MTSAGGQLHSPATVFPEILHLRNIRSISAMDVTTNVLEFVSGNECLLKRKSYVATSIVFGLSMVERGNSDNGRADSKIRNIVTPQSAQYNHHLTSACFTCCIVVPLL